MDDSSLLWNQPEWRAEAHAWIKQAVRVTGPIEQPHARPWSTVMRVPTPEGLCYFKAAMPLDAFEPALIQALAAGMPDCLPEVVAADLERGWMITRDAGTSLRARLHSPEDLRLLDPALPRLAQLQMQWLGRADELLALGLLDRQVETLPALFERLAADREALMVGQPSGLSKTQHARLLAEVPRYAALCQRLAAFPMGSSIHYDDMHTSNIFLRGERITFIDWGDSTVSHPFCSMLIFLREIADRAGLPEESTQTPEGLPPVLARLRDIYLEPWQVYETRANLIEAFNLAFRVGMVGRALTWNTIIPALDEPHQAEYRYTVPAWLGDYLLAQQE
jgi:hypothetical protein